MPWMEQLEAATIALNARSQPRQKGIETEDELVAQMVAHLDAADPLVAFAAKQQLERILSREHFKWIELLLTQQARPPASNGYRFQLLRSALVTPHASSSGAINDTSDANDSSSEEGGGAEGMRPGLETMLKCMKPLSAMAAHTIEDNSPVAVLELLTFLRELVKQLPTVMAEKEDDEILVEEQWLDDLYDLVRSLVAAFRDLEYEKQPTYVSCAIVDFLHEFLRFVTSETVVSNNSNTSDPSRRISSKEWLQTCVDAVLLRSPLSLFAMKLLCSPEPSEISARASLISSESRFPFLQSWLSFISSMALMHLENNNNSDDCAWELLLQTAQSPVIEINDVAVHLPDCDTLLAVLSEQDDVMIDALDTLLRITIILEAPPDESKLGNYQSHWIVKYHREQLDPDLLFASILRTFGHDHLVVLDLLTSSETSTLEYLLRYLRRLAANWDSSCRTLEHQSEQLLAQIMSVLIRLRLEIEKQVAAAIFPYNPTPLLRRLRMVEQLYDDT
ncbi:Lines protein, partial [Globisporangium splendens]